MKPLLSALLLLAASALVSGRGLADEVKVAVAANFTAPMQQIAHRIRSSAKGGRKTRRAAAGVGRRM